MATKTPTKSLLPNATKVAEIPVSVAAKLLGLSHRTVQRLCQEKHLKSAHKPGFGRNAHYRINRLEVISRKYNPTLNQTEI